MDFISKHKTTYGFDRKIVYIKDNLFKLVKDKIESLGYEHVIDNKDILFSEVKTSNKPGYGKINDSFFILCEKYVNIQKARERTFELLCSLRLFLEHLGRFVTEYSSLDDKEFYLIGCLDNPYILVSSKIENDLIVTIINEKLLDYILEYYIHSSLRKEKAGLIIFDSNQSTVQHVKKQILEEGTYYLSNKNNLDEIKEDIRTENIPYFLLLTHSLSKRNEVKIVSFIEDFEKNINVENLDKFLKLYDSKVDKLMFNKTLSCHIENMSNSKELCLKCAKKEEGFIVKEFTQRLNLKKCSCCESNENVFTYKIISNKR